MLYGLEISTIVLVAVQPLIAQQIGIDPLTGWSQLSVIGMLCLLLWWQMAKTAPELQRLHTIEINRTLHVYAENSSKTNANIESMTQEIKGMRKDATDHQKEWVQKLEERPCLGIEGLTKLKEEYAEKTKNV